jgi:hypothetical protein
MNLAPYRTSTLNTLLAGLGVEDEQTWDLLASSFHEGWGEENFNFTMVAAAAEDEGLAAARARIFGRHAYAPDEFLNPETLALKSWQYDGRRLQAECVESDLAAHLAQAEMATHINGIPVGASALAVGIHAVTHDNFLVLGQNEGLWGSTCGGLLGMGEVHGEDIDLVGGAVRSVREQLGLGVKRGSFVFTGLGMDRRTGEARLWGLAYLQQEWSELWLNDERFERMRAVPFRVEEALGALQEGAWDYGGQLGLLEVLIYKYGLDAVFEAVGVRQA